MSVRDGYKMTELGEIPEDWEICLVKDLFHVRQDVSSDSTRYPLCSLTIENGLVNKTDRYERSFLLKNKEENEYRLVHHNDILFNPMNLRFGAIARSKMESVVSVSAYYNIIYLKDNKNTITYYKNLFKSKLMRKIYENTATGSLIEKKRVHLSQFLKLNILLPAKEEQQKIGDILSFNDVLITKIDELIEKTKEVKQGLMQELLTKGIGHTEFKDSELGKIPKEWEVRSLREITTVITKGTTPTTYGYSFVNEGVNFIKIESVDDSSGGFFKDTFAKIDEDCHRKLGRSILAKNDILFAIAGATIGKSAIVTDDVLPANTNQALAIVRLDTGVANSRFVLQVMRSNVVQGTIMNIKSNTAQPNLNLEQIGSFLIPLPSLKEQEDIHSILSSTDRKLQILTKRKQQLEEIKQGLMQDLLTGRVRVNLN